VGRDDAPAMSVVLLRVTRQCEAGLLPDTAAAANAQVPRGCSGGRAWQRQQHHCGWRADRQRSAQ
jgi:hypothetical protein